MEISQKFSTLNINNTVKWFMDYMEKSIYELM
jgi:hypothetical protein